MTTDHDITLLTPTFARDIERFALLRESIERCGIDLPHVAVVHTEDLSAFERIPFRHRLTLLPTAEVLPAALERRRLARGYRRRDPRYWWSRRPLHGWWTQQFVKLLSPQFCDTPAIVTLDSDDIFVRPVQAEDFYASDGRLRLFETEGPITPELAQWFISAARFFEVPARVHVRNYTWAAVALHRQVIADMLEDIERRAAMPWHEAMERHGLMEFTAHGVWARFVNELQHQVACPPTHQAWVVGRSDVSKLAKAVRRSTADSAVRVVRVQSNQCLPTDEVRGVIAQMWEAAHSTEVLT